MSVSAVKGIRWAALLIAVAMVTAAALAPRFDRYTSLALFLGGCALIVVALLWYRRVMPEAEAREEERLAQQLITLKQQLSVTGEPIVVKGSSGAAVLMIGFGGLVISGHAAFIDPSTDTIVMFVCFVLGAAVLALILGPVVGKPPLAIRPDGLAVPVYGFLRWDEIDSIDLRSHTYRGVTTYSIELNVPQLKERESRLHPLLRVSRFLMARRGPNLILVQLRFTQPPATLVHQLCYDVWKARTGKAPAWTSAMSEEEIDKLFANPSMQQRAGKRLSPETLARTQAMLADLGRLETSNSAARHRLVEKHVNAYARDRGTTVAIAAVVFVALLVTALTLVT